MKSLKIIALLTLLSTAVFALNSCKYFNCERAQRYMTLRYNGFYTGIDTLIKVDGYFTTTNISYPKHEFYFYKNGSLMGCKRVRNHLSYLDDSMKGIYHPGFYTIKNDTIVTQVASNESIDIYEVWFKILSNDRLKIIKYERINKDTKKKDCKNCDIYINEELEFFPLAKRPFFPENWLLRCKDMRE